jgi:hypothetical protein
MEWIFVFLSFELAIIFLIKYRESLKSVKNPQELSYAVLFCSYSLQWIWFIVSDYYAPDSEARTLFLIIGYYSLIIGAAIFIFIIETYNTLFKKYFFSYIFLTTIIIFTIFTIIDTRYAQPLSSITLPVFVIFFVTYLIGLSRRSSVKGHVIINFIKLILGFVLVGIGYILTTDWVVLNYGLEFRLWGDIIQIISVFFIYFLFSTLPPLSEYDWYEKINSIFVVGHSGVCIYSKSYQGDEKNLDQYLKIAGLTGIEMVLENITYDKGISVIKKENFTVIIYPSTQIIGMIFCKQELNSLKELLKSFITRVETVYASILLDWKGDLKIFEPIDMICNNIFKKL